MKFVFIAFALFSTILSANDFQIEVYGRSYTFSCSYFSNQSGDYDVVFRDGSLPWGSKVSVICGWKGYTALGGGATQNFDWKDRSEVAAPSSAPYTWTAHIEKTLHGRTDAQFLTGFQFLIKVEVPGSAPIFHNGGTPNGFFQTVAHIKGSPCIDSQESRPRSEKLPFHIVEKWN